MTNIQKTAGIVLDTFPFKESSLFVSILTKNFGKIKVLAKGVRRPKSKLCGTFEPFVLNEIIFYKRESKEVYNLSDAVVIDCFEAIRLSPEKVNGAMVLCEFFNKTLPAEEVDPASFAFLLQFLKDLNKNDVAATKSLVLYYLIRALTGAGVRPHLENCVRCHQPIKYDKRKVDFSIGAGGLVCDKHFDDTVIFFSEKTISMLQRIYKNANIQLDNELFSEIETVIPDYLYYHLNGVVLNSLKYLNRM